MRRFNLGSVQGVRRGRTVLVWAVALCALALAGGCHMFDEEPQQQVLMPQYGYPMYCCQPCQASGANTNCQPAAVTAPAGRTANSSGAIRPIPDAAPAPVAGTTTGGQAFQQSP